MATLKDKIELLKAIEELETTTPHRVKVEINGEYIMYFVIYLWGDSKCIMYNDSFAQDINPLLQALEEARNTKGIPEALLKEKETLTERLGVLNEKIEKYKE